MPRWPWLAGLLIVAVVVGAALLPGATVSITPATTAVGPNTYQLHFAVAGHDSSQLHATQPGSATGTQLEEVAATGSVTFFKLEQRGVRGGAPGNLGVRPGTITFTTNERIVVAAATSRAATFLCQGSRPLGSRRS